MAATVHMRHQVTGGEADFPANREGFWAGLGWEPYEPPAKSAKPVKKAAKTRAIKKSTPPSDSAPADPSPKE